MKKIPSGIIIVLVIAVLIAAKFIFFPKKDAQKTSAQKGGKPSGPVAVNYYVAQEDEVKNTVYTTGKTGALNEIEIKPEIAGKITSIYFKEGESVNKGQTLVKLNDADIQAQYEKNRIQIKLAEEKSARLKKLLAINGISQEEYDMQENEVAALKADRAFLQAQIAKTTITAPFNGVIGLKNISEGAYVSPSQSIASLVQQKPLFIEFSVPEKYSGSIKKGQTLKFSHDIKGTKTYSAQIYAIEPRIDEATKTLKGRAIYSGDETFYPGTFVKVYLEPVGSSQSVMIPTQCVIPILKGQKVFVARNGIAQEVKITTGIRTDEKIQVLDGLKAGDTVLTTGLLAVRKDTPLKLINKTN